MALARDRVLLTADVNLSATDETYTVLTGLNFTVQAGSKYHYKICLLYTVGATTAGVKVGLSANPTTAPTLHGQLFTTALGVATMYGGADASMPRYITSGGTTGGPTSPGTSANSTGGNLAIMEGILVPAATAVLQVEAAADETSASGIAKAGSYLEWEVVG